ncbi:MAG: four helix bundle protein [Candidatus Uhrbacteria bacterium]
MGYDLIERTTKFGENSIEFCRLIKRDLIVDPLIRQYVRSSTSIGANYSEADSAVSKKDFAYKIGVCRREAKETVYWLKMFLTAIPEEKEKILKLLDEAEQLCLIFNSIFCSTKKNLEEEN